MSGSGGIFFYGTLPRLNFDADEDKPTEDETKLARRFVQAREMAPFVFRPEVSEFVEELAQIQRQLNRAKRAIKRIDRTGRPDGLDKAHENERAAEDALEAADHRKTAIFAPEMRLGEVPTSRSFHN